MRPSAEVRDTGGMSVGRQFAEALAAKDFDQAAALLDPEVDFRALTPKRAWEASDPDHFATAILTKWFEESDHIDELLEVEEGEFADRLRMSYAFRGHNDDGPFVVEQVAYFTEREGRIDWLRVLCSGFRPAGARD
jgi:hypothetical protein